MWFFPIVFDGNATHFIPVRNQSKTKAIPHTAFKTSLTTDLDAKLKRLHNVVSGDTNNIYKSFLLKIIIET